VLIFSIPYLRVIKNSIFLKYRESNRDLSYVIKSIIENKEENTSYIVVHEDYDPENLFYINIYNDNNKTICYEHWSNLKRNNIVLASKESIKDSIEKNYKFKVLNQFKTVKAYKINATK